MAIKTIGLRREDKSDWEKRVPLVPADIAELHKQHGIEAIIQPSKIRIFSDDQYQDAGARINESLRSAEIIFAVKEIPSQLLEREKTYLFFSHTIKGQLHNMEMLKRLMQLKCNLIDYELIVDKTKNRLIAFGRYAGIAGMIETLHAYGRKMKLKGYATPFEEIKQAYRYESLHDATAHIEMIGRRIIQHGFPKELSPLTVGFLGYGNVSRGAQEIFDLLPAQTIKPNDLKQLLTKTIQITTLSLRLFSKKRIWLGRSRERLTLEITTITLKNLNQFFLSISPASKYSLMEYIGLKNIHDS